MDLQKQMLDLFDRSTFSFKQLKEMYSAGEIEQIKCTYKTNWQQWKKLNQEITSLLPDDLAMLQPKVESWTNGWNIRNHFWCAYRSSNRKEENACLATLLNKKQYQVYLMFQHYKSDQRNGSIEEYNALLEQMNEWSQTIDIQHYFIWPQVEHELEDHLPLSEYLASKEIQHSFKEQLLDRTFQIGRLYLAEDLPLINCEKQTVATLEELARLYKKI